MWVTNALVFSLLYWQIDRGGPEARIAHARSKPDWLFPQEGAPDGDVSLLTVVVVASRAINILAQ